MSALAASEPADVDQQQGNHLGYLMVCQVPGGTSVERQYLLVNDSCYVYDPLSLSESSYGSK